MITLPPFTGIIGPAIAAGGGGDPGNIVHMDSADMISSGTTPAGTWWTAFSGSNPSSVSGITNAYGRCWQTSNGGAGIFTLPSPTSNDVVLRVRFRFSVDQNDQIARGDEASNDNQLIINQVAGGNFSIAIGGATLATSTGGHMVINHWYVIEARNLIDNSSGHFEADLYDGEGAGEWDLLESISFDGDTRDAGTSGVVNQIIASLGTIGGTAWWDDIIVDASGEKYGPARIEVLAPDGAGHYTQLTPNTGTNFSAVNEVPMSTTGNFVDSTGTNQRDSYTLADRSIAGTPRCVGLHALASAASALTFKLFLRIGGVDYDSPLLTVVAGSSDVWSYYWQNNPATGAAWTDSDIDAMEVGILAVDSGLRFRSLLVQVLVQL